LGLRRQLLVNAAIAASRVAASDGFAKDQQQQPQALPNTDHAKAA
jgi:hypothetical protein